MLRIETLSDASQTSIRLIGRVRSDDIAELRRHIDGAERRRIVLDLSEVTLVDLDVIRFLIACEDTALEVRHCSRYIREWMHQERLEGN